MVGSVLFPLLISTTVIIINFVAIYYHASRAIPFTTMVGEPLWMKDEYNFYAFLDYCCLHLFICCATTKSCGCNSWTKLVWKCRCAL